MPKVAQAMSHAHSSLIPKSVEDEFWGMQRGSAWFFRLEPAPRVDKMPKRRKTSEQVTKMEIMIRMMMMYVSPSVERVLAKVRSSKEGKEREGWACLLDILLSAMESERISARSRKTRQRSLRTWIRGFISRYSRTPK